ncbi:MAG: DNA-binding protein [Lachnospiraceae bacterium]|nr:DNA-binding protein [Lachnospiraceae bacterium]
MEKLIERGLLYDSYGGLLNEKNKRIYEACAVDDMSLSEIAEEIGISRQAVSETLNRTDIRLRRYEEELGLIAKRKQILTLLDEMRSVLDAKSVDKKRLKAIADSIEEVI